MDEPRPGSYTYIPLPGAERPEDRGWIEGSVTRDGRSWRLGTAADAAWINDGIRPGRTIAAAIPPVFPAYATVELPENEWRADHEAALLEALRAHTAEQPWWLGYLDTGADDVVFPDARRVLVYSGWPYVLVEAGPDEAATWRNRDRASFWCGVLPNLMFPADRSLLASALWDDDWTCVGGPVALVDRLCDSDEFFARRVVPGEDATPPGHTAH